MLKFLLDEHISPAVAEGLRRREAGLVVCGMAEWEEGRFLSEADDMILEAAFQQGLTLVTYDRRTIPPILKQWAEAGRSHAGVVFVDDKTISPSDLGGMSRALHELWKQSHEWDWAQRIVFLRR